MRFSAGTIRSLMNSCVVWWLNMTGSGRTSIVPAATASLRRHDEDRQAQRFVPKRSWRRRSCEQEQQIRMLGPGDEDLLAVDSISVALANGGGFDPRRVRARVRLSDSKRLQAPLAGGDLGLVAVLLLLAAVAKQSAHHVHLRVASRRVSVRAVDLFEDDAGLPDPETRSAEFLTNQRGEEARLRQRVDEILRYACRSSRSRQYSPG